MKHWITGAVLVVIVGVGKVQAVTIPAGYDFFITGSAFVDIPGVGRIDLVSNPLTGWAPDANGDVFFAFPPEVIATLGVFMTTWLDPHGTVTHDAEHAVRTVLDPRPGLAPFDTTVKRVSDLSVSGKGSTVEGDLQMEWLSLKSVAPRDYLGLGFDQNVYVGLDSGVTGPQPVGRMQLTSGTENGESGHVSIGTGPNPEGLGLPLNYRIYFVPTSTDQLPSNAVFTATGEKTFYNDSGTYSVVPEPSTLMVWSSLGVMGLIAAWRRWKRAV